MALRIKSQWHDEDAERSMQEIAGALAFNGWKIAMNQAINLHGQRFIYENDRQRLAVIAEYLIFEIQLVERLTHDTLDMDQRRTLITTLALRLADTLDENSHDLLGPGDYRSDFIERLNQQSSEYAGFKFTRDGPSYPFTRHFGFQVQQLMGDGQENRWVIDQIMDKDAPEVYKQFKRIIRNLFD